MMTEQQIKAALDGKFWRYADDMEVEEHHVEADAACDNYKPNFQTSQEYIARRQQVAAVERDAQAEAIAAAAARAASNPVRSPLDVLAIVAAVTGISVDQMIGPRRLTPMVRARAIACVLMKKHLGMTDEAIGRRVKRDHSSVSHLFNLVAGDPAKFEPALTEADEILIRVNAQRPPGKWGTRGGSVCMTPAGQANSAHVS